MYYRSRGITLVELMIVLAIIAILVTMSAPSFKGAFTRNSIDGVLKDLGRSVSFARSETISRNRQVVMCGSVDMLSCVVGSDWSEGWIVFIDDGNGGGISRDNLRNGNEEILREYDYRGTNLLNVVDDGGTALPSISFNSRGNIAGDYRATIRVCDEDNDIAFARALLIDRTGRSARSLDLKTSGGTAGSDGIYEDVNGNNLSCT